MGNCCAREDPERPAVFGNIEADSQAQRDAADAVALLTGAAAYCTWLELQVTCTKLRDADVFSKSDPMAVLWEMGPNEEKKELGRTEVISNCLNPGFVRRFKLQFNFEKVTELMIQIVDIDSKDGNPVTCNPDNADQLGWAKFKINEVVKAQGQRMTLPLRGAANGHNSQVTILAEEMSNAREVLTLNISGRSLRNVETFRKSDPFLEISRRSETGGWQPCYRTEVVFNNLNPDWKQITIKATQLNNGDPYRPLRLRVFDWEQSGNHREMGVVECNAMRLHELASTREELPLLPHPKAGFLMVTGMTAVVQPTFLDYIQAGVEIGFIVSIDFTGSNGNPVDPSSKHYISPSGALTQYEEAICGVGQVLEYYDSDRMFQVFGFGGQYRSSPPNHCFSLGDNPSGLVQGVEGIRVAYRQALTQWSLSGPTLFAPTIRMAAAVAAQPTPHIRYTVLLILTDGAIMDMMETADAIVEASSLPLSVLIVGIGTDDFGSMHVLDGDEVRLESKGRKAERDIVQFVEFAKHRNNGEALATELLAELPGQFMSWVRAKNIPVPQMPFAQEPEVETPPQID